MATPAKPITKETITSANDLGFDQLFAQIAEQDVIINRAMEKKTELLLALDPLLARLGYTKASGTQTQKKTSPKENAGTLPEATIEDVLEYLTKNKDRSFRSSELRTALNSEVQKVLKHIKEHGLANVTGTKNGTQYQAK